MADVRKFIVLGIGNVLMTDDGVGIHVIRDLLANRKPSTGTKDEIEFLDGGTLGFLLSDRISGADGLIIVDAANIKESSGSIRVLNGNELDCFLEDQASASVHEVGLIDLLDMMTLGNQAPKHRALVGIQPEVVDWGIELSPPLKGSVARASSAVNQVLASWMVGVETCQS